LFEVIDKIKTSKYNRCISADSFLIKIGQNPKYTTISASTSGLVKCNIDHQIVEEIIRLLPDTKAQAQENTSSIIYLTIGALDTIISYRGGGAGITFLNWVPIRNLHLRFPRFEMSEGPASIEVVKAALIDMYGTVIYRNAFKIVKSLKPIHPLSEIVSGVGQVLLIPSDAKTTNYSSLTSQIKSRCRGATVKILNTQAGLLRNNINRDRVSTFSNQPKNLGEALRHIGSNIERDVKTIVCIVEKSSNTIDFLSLPMIVLGSTGNSISDMFLGIANYLDPKQYNQNKLKYK
jgi:hypothetical protein